MRKSTSLKSYLVGLIFSVAVMAVANAGTVECAYLTRSKLVPVNDTAIALAESLNVVTCGRDADSNFRLKGKALGLKAVVVGMTKARRAKYNAFKLKKLMKKKSTKSNGSAIW